MQADRFRALLDAKGPFASVYFDDSHNTEDAAAQLDIRWRDLRRDLEQQGADGALLDSIEAAMLGSTPPVGPSGRALIADAEGVVVDEHLIRPPASTAARLSELPYLVPIVAHGLHHHPYILAAVDHAGADLTLHRSNGTSTETVDGAGYPVHHASGAETPGYGDPQRTAEGAQAKNIRAVAERLTALVDETGAEVVFVLGEVRSRTDLISDLPERVADRVTELKVGARNSGVDDEELARAMQTEFQLRRNAVIDDAAQRFTAESGRGSGLAAEGLAAVCAALRDGAVETLIIGELGDATVVAGEELLTLAPDADVLSELGVPPSRTLRADEALPMAAVATDAALIRTDERISPADGVAAVLRYARSHH